MNPDPLPGPDRAVDEEALSDAVDFHFALNRRQFVGVLGAGLLVTVQATSAAAQPRRGEAAPATRIHLSQDGDFTVLTGKIEMGQGARAELSQAAAEELRVGASRVRMWMGDTAVVPDDGITAGSRTTPSTLPAVREAAATARQLLVQVAAKQWNVGSATIEVQEGRLTHAATQRSTTYAELARSQDVTRLFHEAAAGVELTAVKEWKVMGQSLPRPNRRDLVTGSHQFPSDIRRPGMLYGKVLRAPTYGARLIAVDLEPAKAMPGVTAVRDGAFVGVAAPTTHRARQALAAIAATAQWETAPHPSYREVHDYLRHHAQGGVPANPFAPEVASAKQAWRQTYRTAYVAHAPLEPRVALAEWSEGQLTVWTGTQAPFGYHSELARTFRLPPDRVRVMVPDFGSGFGGKHTAEAAIEAARLAQAAGRPVRVAWTREEEFTWAYFRPAAVIDVEATLNEQGQMTSWHFVNINSGGASVDTPYRISQARSRFVASDSPVRQGSYRALAATANNFARECAMDELAALAGTDPLAFRLAHLDHPRLRAVLEEAARQFGWGERVKERHPDQGVGLACGTEKGSYVAACVRIEIDRERQRLVVRQVCEVFECGAIVNPDNLLSQVQACILMGLGPALREEMRFVDGKLGNAAFAKYAVPRLSDVPDLDIHLLPRPDLPSVGGGETPIIAIAPAIANAVYHATGRRVRAMPIRFADFAGT